MKMKNYILAAILLHFGSILLSQNLEVAWGRLNAQGNNYSRREVVLKGIRINHDLAAEGIGSRWKLCRISDRSSSL